MSSPTPVTFRADEDGNEKPTPFQLRRESPTPFNRVMSRRDESGNLLYEILWLPPEEHESIYLMFNELARVKGKVHSLHESGSE